MIYLAWKVLGTTRSFSLTGKACLAKCFYLYLFLLWALAPLQIPTSLCEGPFFYFMQFLFLIWVSILSYKALTRMHYERTWALGVVDTRVCFMNRSMIDYDGLGITYFSIDILKGMVACWYAWVLMSLCHFIDYRFESSKSKCPCYKIKDYIMNMIGSIPQQKYHFQLLVYHDKFYEKDLLLWC